MYYLQHHSNTVPRRLQFRRQLKQPDRKSLRFKRHTRSKEAS